MLPYLSIKHICLSGVIVVISNLVTQKECVKPNKSSSFFKMYLKYAYNSQNTSIDKHTVCIRVYTYPFFRIFKHSHV